MTFMGKTKITDTLGKFKHGRHDGLKNMGHTQKTNHQTMDTWREYEYWTYGDMEQGKKTKMGYKGKYYK